MPASSKNSDEITVRMFCQGLGDCFLISIPQANAAPYHILIDCGVAMGTENAEPKMRNVVQQITELTGGAVDLLAITHEHWDHVSGFVQAQDEFHDVERDQEKARKEKGEEKKKLKVKHLWMAWTEDPKDDLALELKAQYGKAKAATLRALSTLRQKNGLRGLDKVRTGVEGVLAFFGPEPAADEAAVGIAAAKKAGNGKQKSKTSKAGSLAAAMDFAKARVGSDSKATTFLLPGETRVLPGAAHGTTAGAVKVRVLGPPHEAAQVRKLNSTTETYKKQQAHFGGVSWAWMSGLAADGSNPLAMGDHEALQREAAMPFEGVCRIPFAKAEKDPFFQRHYFKAPRRTPEEKEGFAMRRIDGDWLGRGAEQLALWINSYTNNVSLVLAFELPKSGKVLLFVGDAQVGNWLSWHDIKMFKDDADKEVTMKDLFAKTVLYKVGHHGSHNATLRQKGLEMMTHPDLVAMLPVDEKSATTLGYGEMPLVSLQDAIKERADGRLLRLDRPWKGATPGTWPTNLTRARYVKGRDQIVGYMEYTVQDH